jgi:3-dehydroquinate synthase
MSYFQKLNVKFSYKVIFTKNVFKKDNNVLSNIIGQKNSSMVIFIDKGVIQKWPFLQKDIINWYEHHRNLKLVSSPILVQGGEKVKNINIINKVGNIINKYNLCRHSFVIIVGGGAVLDAIGFAAPITHRGLRQIRIPTTVLSQLDSGVGVKNGINHFGIKNYYGTFAPPFGVINDTEFIKTLSNRDWVSGIAEAFKVAIIKDKNFLKFLSKNAEKLHNRDYKTMVKTIKKCAYLHLDHIKKGKDPFEFGSSRPLDFGHWAAHRLEELTNFSLRHGEAVAVGIALDLHCCVKLGLISESDCEYACNAMERCGLTLWHPALEDKSILVGLEEFRKHLGGKLTLTMPDGIGRKVEIHELPEKIILDSIKKLKHRKFC